MEVLVILGVVLFFGLVIGVPAYLIFGGANGRNWRRIREDERRWTEQEKRERQSRKS